MSGGGQASLLGYVNCFVHTCMYLYYFLTSFKPEMKQSLWWKKHLTQLQLLQFIVLATHFAVPLFSGCDQSPKFVLCIAVVQNSFMFLLFGDFYIRTYIKKRK